jgi:MOSC domain-containing protein YiiM
MVAQALPGGFREWRRRPTSGPQLGLAAKQPTNRVLTVELLERALRQDTGCPRVPAGGARGRAVAPWWRASWRLGRGVHGSGARRWFSPLRVRRGFDAATGRVFPLIAATGTAHWWDKPWHTGFFKQAHPSPLSLGPAGLEGDEQADRINHGGADKAVCLYPAEHYEYWRTALLLPDLPPGAFGENFTTQGLSESDVCIGDVFAFASGAVVQVSQPRQPCWKLARRWRIKDLAAQVGRTGRTGWYFRVLAPGRVTVGDALALQQRPHPEWPVSAANEIMHHRKDDRHAAAALAACPALSASWRSGLTARAADGSLPPTTLRTEPPSAFS